MLGTMVLSVLAGMLAYIAYWIGSIPIPMGFKDPWFLRMFLGIFKLMWTVTYFLEFFYDPKDILIGLRNMNLFKEQAVTLPVKKEDKEISGVKVRVFTPEGLPASSNPGIVYYHGGGWVLGSVEKADGFCQHMAQDVGAVVISVEYRMAPEHPYPAPLDDCVAAVTYVLQHPEEFGVDPKRICIAGDSAGGNLAAATALRLRDTKIQPQPKLQALAYPCLQAIDINSPSYIANRNDPLLPRKLMTTFWLLYATGQLTHRDKMIANEHTTPQIKKKMAENQLNHKEIIRGYSARDYTKPDLDAVDEKIWNKLESIFTDPYFAPLMAQDVSNLPEALIFTSEQDVLRDDGIWYAKYLKEAGVKVNHIHYNSGFHGIITGLAEKANFIEVHERFFGGIKSVL